MYFDDGAVQAHRFDLDAHDLSMRPVARVLRVVLPSALPEVLLGCRVALAMALIVMITSEMIARQSGAGNILFNSLDM